MTPRREPGAGQRHRRHPPGPNVERGTITTIGVGELLEPGRPVSCCCAAATRRGWCPTVPNGWDMREPWHGDINSVRWIGGPPAEAAFRRVGAPV